MFGLLFPFFGKYAADHFKAAVERTKLQAACAALIGGALFFTALFFCLAVFFCLWTVMSPIIAAFIIAAIWLLIAIIGFLCLKISIDRRRARRRAQGLMTEEQKKLLANTALAAAPGLLGLGLKSFKNIGLLAALAVGTAAACGILQSKASEDDN